MLCVHMYAKSKICKQKDCLLAWAQICENHDRELKFFQSFQRVVFHLYTCKFDPALGLFLEKNSCLGGKIFRQNYTKFHFTGVISLKWQILIRLHFKNESIWSCMCTHNGKIMSPPPAKHKLHSSQPRFLHIIQVFNFIGSVYFYKLLN